MLILMKMGDTYNSKGAGNRRSPKPEFSFGWIKSETPCKH